ncbi:MAG: NAD(P)H-dependent glycerol-3-phosphate dehydrogenase [Pseudomonadota bacterium]
MSDIAVIGGGAWGTALASVLARAGHRPILLMRDPTRASDMNASGENRKYLPGIKLPPEIHATALMSEIKSASNVLVVTPAQTLRDVLIKHSEFIGQETRLILCSKGIEQETGKRVSEIAAETCPGRPLAILSGPSFADDVARGLPTAVTLAAETLDAAISLCETLSASHFRLYATDDIAGAELGGALKNVFALAVGMARGRGLGASAEAALITRGFAELQRLARHFGARPETLTGLSGLGDLILTCSSPQSRNFAYGFAVGEGRNLSGMKLAEGVHTAGIAADLARKEGIDAPIMSVVHAVLSDKLSVDDAIAGLLKRPLKAESM